MEAYHITKTAHTRGARQVGKTYLLKSLGAKHYRNTVYVNFDNLDSDIRQLFEGAINYHRSGYSITCSRYTPRHEKKRILKQAAYRAFLDTPRKLSGAMLSHTVYLACSNVTEGMFILNTSNRYLINVR